MIIFKYNLLLIVNLCSEFLVNHIKYNYSYSILPNLKDFDKNIALT